MQRSQAPSQLPGSSQLSILDHKFTHCYNFRAKLGSTLSPQELRKSWIHPSRQCLQKQCTTTTPERQLLVRAQRFREKEMSLSEITHKNAVDIHRLLSNYQVLQTFLHMFANQKCLGEDLSFKFL